METKVSVTLAEAFYITIHQENETTENMEECFELQCNEKVGILEL